MTSGPSLSVRHRTLEAMDADRPLKKLFQLRTRDLLALTGDRGARVVSRQIPELAAVSRRLDFVIKLERDGEIYLRHLEFEMHRRGDLASRMFEYAAALAAHHGLPVLSTAIILTPPAPPTLTYEERVRGRVVCWRRIRVVRLWRMRPATAMRLGVGGAALVGLMGRPDIKVVEAAARRIEAGAPPRQYRDLSAVLRMLSQGRYTARELERVVPKEVVMGSSLLAEVRRAGRAEGEIAAARSLCAALAKQHHAATLPQVAAVIRACRDTGILYQWALAAPRVSDERFVRLVQSRSSAATPSPRKTSSARTRRARAARPSRRAKPSRRR
jgi:hypothetical protein